MDIVSLCVNNVKDVLDVKREKPFRTVILDEMSIFKGRGVWWKTMRKIIKDKKHPVEHVWGLTGTPSPNGLLDLWPQTCGGR